MRISILLCVLPVASLLLTSVTCTIVKSKTRQETLTYKTEEEQPTFINMSYKYNSTGFVLWIPYINLTNLGKIKRYHTMHIIIRPQSDSYNSDGEIPKDTTTNFD